MKPIFTSRMVTWLRLISIGAVLCSHLGLLPLNAAAQEPTVEPTSLPTPTTAPTWTPVPPANTPTPTTPPGSATPTPSGRVVDFRVDDDKIDKGNCVTFSWIVRGDLDRVEFDTKDDGKAALLVSDSDSREACPEVDTKYELTATWLDGTRTVRTIEIEINDDSGAGDGDGSSSTATPAGTAVFVPVTPIPIVVTPTSVPPQGSASPADSTPAGGAVIVPAGPLGSVSALPETGYWSSSATESDQPESDFRASPSVRTLPIAIAGGLIIPLGAVSLGFLIVVKIARDSEASQ